MKIVFFNLYFVRYFLIQFNSFVSFFVIGIKITVCGKFMANNEYNIPRVYWKEKIIGKIIYGKFKSLMFNDIKIPLQVVSI